MSPTMFFIGDSPFIKCFEYDDNDTAWTCKYTFEGHTAVRITSLTKVNETLFVSTSQDRTAKVWDITKGPACVFTFLAHTTPIGDKTFESDGRITSSVYLKEEKAIATGDAYGNIAVWSIAKYLDNNQDKEEDEVQNGSDSRDAADQETSDQEPITAEP